MRRLLRPGTVLVILLFCVRPSVAQQYRVDTLARAPFIESPSAIAFSPDGSGKLFFGEKNTGRVRVYNHALLPEPFVTVSVENDGEQGLLGLALYPSYPDTPFVFLSYTRAIDRSLIVERYRDSSGVGVDPTLLLIVPRLDDATTNNGGSIHFGPDNELYLSVGDQGATPWNAQDTSSGRNYRGKILRLNPDGSTPPDNPIPKKPFWSFGHRNAAGFTFDRETGTMYSTEGGPRYRNEVVRLPRGSNLGWPINEQIRMNGSPDPPRRLYLFRGPAQPNLTSIVVYRNDLFPRLRGKVLFGGTDNPTLWVGSLAEMGEANYPDTFFKCSTGYSDVQIAPNGSIVVSSGHSLSSKVLRISPVAPVFVSTPALNATYKVEYSYLPIFNGTQPEVTVVSGPTGMTVDATTSAVHWKPTKAQALEGISHVTLRARNGAGVSEQVFTIRVYNVDEAPSEFSLIAPVDAIIPFTGGNPTVTFTWQQALEPDQDTVRYLFQLDTASSFSSPARKDTSVGTADSLQLVLPRLSGDYYWRVVASDGKLTTVSTPPYRRLSISFLAALPVRAEKVQPKDSNLGQNFPNPFNPATSIRYSIPRSGYVRLSVFNLLGQEVARLFDGVQNEGTYEVEFTRVNLPSGIYFYRIQAPGLVETKKMIIAR